MMTGKLNLNQPKLVVAVPSIVLFFQIDDYFRVYFSSRVELPTVMFCSFLTPTFHGVEHRRSDALDS